MAHHCHHHMKNWMWKNISTARRFSVLNNNHNHHVKSTAFLVRIGNHPGALEEVLRVLREEKVNLTRIESRPSSSSCWDVFLDAKGAVNLPLSRLSKVAQSVDILGPLYVPWFPRRRGDLDAFTHKTLDAGEQLESDHPGFTDPVYRTRRDMIVKNARNFRTGERLPFVEYSTAETETWGKVYDELKKRHPLYTCEEYRSILDELEGVRLYSRNRIPQLQELNDWLKSKTGWILRPVTGLLSARDFLNGLAVKCFHSTQYIRHHSKPFYTPEPDVIHELMGHVPMLGDKDFADLSHDIGLASLGASDSDIKRLATCYWFSVEFGLVKQNNKRMAYGAGLLSSFGEMEYSCTGQASGFEPPEYADWEPEIAAETNYPITTYQPKYFVADSLRSAAESTRRFCNFDIKRPFFARFDDETGQIITIDREVKRRGSVTEVTS
jgi:phenylalanine-4-hydroxylase